MLGCAAERPAAEQQLQQWMRWVRLGDLMPPAVKKDCALQKRPGTAAACARLCRHVWCDQRRLSCHGLLLFCTVPAQRMLQIARTPRLVDCEEGCLLSEGTVGVEERRRVGCLGPLRIERSSEQAILGPRSPGRKSLAGRIVAPLAGRIAACRWSCQHA